MFEIITADELLQRLEGHNHKELHVHHTYRPDHSDWNKNPDGLFWQKSMKRYHVEKQHFSDIAQHVTLLPDGRFVTGRPFDRIPASIAGYNQGAFAVETLGDFDIGHDVLQGAQKESLFRLARWFNGRGRYIRFHREDSPKTCPGSSIDKGIFMMEVRSGEPEPDKKNRREMLIMKKGDKGSEVQKVQHLIMELGYTLQRYGADGVFGNETEGAVNAFKKDNDLPQDGIVDIPFMISIAEKFREKSGKVLSA